MTELIPGIRNAARALIIQQEQILLLRKEGGGRGERYALPGGAQDTGETLEQALQRECQEEIGTQVEVGKLLHVADFFKHRDTQPPTQRHLLEFLFRCNVPSDYQPHNGHRPDKHQVEVVWASLESISDIALFPPFLSTCIPPDSSRSLYLGTFHDQAIS
jgi:8-oxo-dGTP diphosphatase